MAYIGRFANVLEGLGCGKTCGCKSCHTNNGLAETYVRDEPDEDDDPEDGDKDDDTARMSGAFTPAHVVIDHQIAGARELWRPVVQGGMGHRISRQFGPGPRSGLHPADVASVQHLGIIAATPPWSPARAQLVNSVAACLADLGVPNLARRHGVIAACLAGFFAGPAVAAPLVQQCLNRSGVVLTLPTVARLLTCVAARVSQAGTHDGSGPAPGPVRDPHAV